MGIFPEGVRMRRATPRNAVIARASKLGCA